MAISNIWVAPHELDDQRTVWLVVAEVDGDLNFLGAAASEAEARGFIQSVEDAALAARPNTKATMQ